MDTHPKAPDNAPGAPGFCPALPPGIDRRTRPARRWRELVAAFTEATPHKPLSAPYSAMVGNLATVTLQLEVIAAQAAQGAPVDHDDLIRMTNAQGRLMAALGLAAWGREEPPEPPKPDPVAEHRRHMGWDK